MLFPVAVDANLLTSTQHDMFDDSERTPHPLLSSTPMELYPGGEYTW